MFVLIILLKFLGNSIPHPCKVNDMWVGVGNSNSHGGAVRNAFDKAEIWFGNRDSSEAY